MFKYGHMCPTLPITESFTLAKEVFQNFFKYLQPKINVYKSKSIFKQLSTSSIRINTFPNNKLLSCVQEFLKIWHDRIDETKISRSTKRFNNKNRINHS